MKTRILLLFMVLTSSLFTSKTNAQGAPFMGQIAFVAFNFAPKGWAECNGQILPIAQNTGLFSILGTTYGGDGITTFALPDMRGRVLVHAGQGPGLSYYTQGQSGGVESVTLSTSQIPAHTHTVAAVSSEGNQNNPTGRLLADTKTLDKEYSDATANTTMSPAMISPTGGNQPHTNLQPYLTLKCIIAIEGIFPARS
jgi:microcystin-dependent protein